MNNEYEINQAIRGATRIMGGVILTTSALEAYQLLNNTTPIVEAADCRIRVGGLNQFYIDKGGATWPNGRPMFQLDVDEIVGPAVNRKHLIEAGGQSKVVTSDNNGGFGFVEFNGTQDGTYKNQPALKVHTQDLQNGTSAELNPIPCNTQSRVTIMTEQGSKQDVQRGATVQPSGTRLDTTPAPNNIPTIKPTALPVSTSQAVMPTSTRLDNINVTLNPTKTDKPDLGPAIFGGLAALGIGAALIGAFRRCCGGETRTNNQTHEHPFAPKDHSHDVNGKTGPAKPTASVKPTPIKRKP